MGLDAKPRHSRTGRQGGLDRRSRNTTSLPAKMSARTSLRLWNPSGLYTGADGATVREAYRQFVAVTMASLAALVSEELSNKIGVKYEISFGRLAAVDIAARARSYGILINAGVEDADARELTGLDG